MVSIRANVWSNAILNITRQQPMARRGRFATHLQAPNNDSARCVVVQNSRTDLGSVYKATDKRMGNSEPVPNTFRFATITKNFLGGTKGNFRGLKRPERVSEGKPWLINLGGGGQKRPWVLGTEMPLLCFP